MTDPRKLAAALVDDAWSTPAAILVAKIDDPELQVLRSDCAHLATLEQCGCLANGMPTALGQRVGIVLRTVHGIEPWPRGIAH